MYVQFPKLNRDTLVVTIAQQKTKYEKLRGLILYKNNIVTRSGPMVVMCCDKLFGLQIQAVPHQTKLSSF